MIKHARYEYLETELEYLNNNTRLEDVLARVVPASKRGIKDNFLEYLEYLIDQRIIRETKDNKFYF